MSLNTSATFFSDCNFNITDCIKRSYSLCIKLVKGWLLMATYKLIIEWGIIH